MLNVNKKFAIAAAMVGGCTLAVAAYAKGDGEHGPRHGRGGGHMFEMMDGNKDGIVTKAEITAFTESRVKEFDGNRDGQITRAEFDAAHKAKRDERHQARFKKLDVNGDGQITRTEFDASGKAKQGERGQTWFNKLDANGDGQISAEEFGNAKAGRWSKGSHDGV